MRNGDSFELLPSVTITITTEREMTCESKICEAQTVIIQ